MKFDMEWWDADGNEVVCLRDMVPESLISLTTGMQPGDSLTVTRTDDVS
jgi:hypothetical protein